MLARKWDDMTTAEHLDSIGTLKQLTESWKSSLEKYEGVTPYLEKLTHRSVAEWQPLARSTVDGINPRAVHNNWIMEGWPQRLLRARLSRAMTQKEAAHACGVAEQTYERWERGEQPPAIGNVPKVLSFIQCAEEKAGSQFVDQRPGSEGQ